MSSIPDSVKRAIADQLFHDEIWQLPDEFPPSHDISAALLVIEPLCTPINPEAIAINVDRLMIASNYTATKAQHKAMVANWSMINGDLPSDLWIAGMTVLFRQIAGGGAMPEPPALRSVVIAKFMDRLKTRDRIYKLYDAKDPLPVTPPETLEQREIAIRDAYHKHGYLDRAAFFEGIIAKREGRDPAPWVFDVRPETEMHKAPVRQMPSPIQPAVHALLLRSLAASWKRCGAHAHAETYLSRAQLLHPIDTEGRHVDLIPEAEHEELS